MAPVLIRTWSSVPPTLPTLLRLMEEVEELLLALELELERRPLRHNSTYSRLETGTQAKPS
jgi:hypothetical protein